MNKNKNKYCTPVVIEVRLDNEISLQLASTVSTTPPTFESIQSAQYSPSGIQASADPYQYEQW